MGAELGSLEPSPSQPGLDPARWPLWANKHPRRVRGVAGQRPAVTPRARSPELAARREGPNRRRLLPQCPDTGPTPGGLPSGAAEPCALFCLRPSCPLPSTGAHTHSHTPLTPHTHIHMPSTPHTQSYTLVHTPHTWAQHAHSAWAHLCVRTHYLNEPQEHSSWFLMGWGSLGRAPSRSAVSKATFNSAGR